jgi:UDP-glucose 4-epimerase
LFHGADFDDVQSVWPIDRPIDCVIHLAARVHVMSDSSADSLAAYRRTNVVGALRVARAASLAGARRFVFVSSVKALGEIDPGRPWCETDLATPADPYGQSKLEAENALFSLGREIGLDVVVIRPPLVYGPGVRANFLQLIRAIQRRLPLPLGAVDSRRSMIFVENLASALLLCATHPGAAGRLFHVSDGHDLSVADLAKALGRELKRPARLISVPPSMLRLAGRLCGRLAQVNRLIDPLRLDITRIGTELGWHPPHSAVDGLRATVEWYRAAH